MPQDNEASVEEILESIKKVIARDNRDTALEVRRKRIADAEEADERRVNSVDTTSVDSDEVLDLADMEYVDDEDIAWDGKAEAAESDEAADPQLTTEAVRGAMRENFAALAMLAEPGAPPQIVRSGETSLEGLTRELMRPMLAEWLDKNLPGIVEKLVQAEIAKISRKRR